MANDKSDKKNYKQTLNLPQTAFPMEAKLVHVTSEGDEIEWWHEIETGFAGRRPL